MEIKELKVREEKVNARNIIRQLREDMQTMYNCAVLVWTKECEATEYC